MSGDELHVDTTDLRAKAIQIHGLHLVKSILGGTDPQAPDALSLSKTAVENLRQNIRFLVANQLCGSQEGDRLAESLNSVAQAYDEVDAASRASIEGVGPPAEPKMPAGNKIPAPTPPAPMGNPGAVTADEVGDVEKTQELLSNGDHGASLRAAAAEWEGVGTMLRTAAGTFGVRIQNWEGEAADQAYAKFVEFGEWLSDLGDAWHRLAGEAFRISDAHVKALLDHTPIYQQYEQLKSQMIAAIQNGGSAAHTLGVQMEALHHQSEAVLHGYAGEAAPHAVSTTRSIPSTGVPTVPAVSGGSRTNNGGGQQGGGGGAGSGGGGGAPSSPQSAGTSGMSTAGPSGGESAGKGGESPAGGGSPSSGSGSPTGGGAPSGSTGGRPSGQPTGLPTLPDGPNLHPASAGAGGGAGGGSGGGAGGGMGPAPLQPSVAGKSVGPGAAGGASTGTAPVGAGASGGVMGGGMGGAPMGGHGQNQSGKEKRRTPGLSPDEDMYVEDREYTEEVIGARKRRTLQDPKDAT